MSALQDSESAAIPKRIQRSLSEQERSRLRFHLENLWNETHLLVQNQKSDAIDIQRQDRDFAFFEIFDRVPFEPRIPELQKELNASAKEFGIELLKIQVSTGIQNPPAPPKEVYTDTKRFRFSEDQLVEKLKLKIIGQGSLPQANQWVATWPTQVLRLVVIDSSPQQIASSKTTAKTQNSDQPKWEIQAHAFRFRKLTYPRLKPRDPLDLLPQWARQNPEAFAQAEPFLWSFVTRIQEWKPKAHAAYENRRKFFLNDARMSFYLHQTRSLSEAQWSSPRLPKR